MRQRKNKFAMVFKDGVEINTMADLHNNFDFRKVMEYFQSRRLTTWLDDRFYADEADAIKTLRLNDRNTPQKICEILGVNYEDYAEELDDEETAQWRLERRERLKQYTTEETIIKKIDSVAFDQEDLEDILRDSNFPPVIYLCNNFFRFPSGMLRRRGITYIGIGGNVAVKVDTQKPVKFQEYM